MITETYQFDSEMRDQEKIHISPFALPINNAWKKLPSPDYLIHYKSP